MNNRILITILAAVCAFFSFRTKAQDEPEPLNDTLRQEIVDSIVSDYYDWHTVSMSGKLSSSLLPINPSVKIYMEREKLVVISIAAPLIGEVARIEIDRDEVLAVNKMKDTYSTMSMAAIEPIMPGGLTAIQNLLLGRITILGEGELSSKNAASVNIYETQDSESLLVLPLQDLENTPFVYLYTVSAGSYLPERFIILTETDAGDLECNYEWGERDMTLNFETELKGKPLGASLKLNLPDSKTKEIKRIDLNSNYKQVDLKGLLRM